MKKEKVCGIYCIENLINGKKYVGLSRNINQRLCNHKTHLNGGYHINEHLQSSWNKYGKENFKFYIVEVCNENVLKEREIFYIKEYQTSNRLYGYNKTSGGDGIKDISDECANKISIAETLYPIVCINFDGNLIGEYRNCREAADFCNGKTENIRNCCNKMYGYKSQYGYIWMYKEDYLQNGFNKNNYIRNIPNQKKIDVYTLEGDYINTYNSQHEVEKILGIPFKNVSQVCKGHRRQSHGYICRFHNESFNKYITVRKDGKICALR